MMIMMIGAVPLWAVSPLRLIDWLVGVVHPTGPCTHLMRMLDANVVGMGREQRCLNSMNLQVWGKNLRV